MSEKRNKLLKNLYAGIALTAYHVGLLYLLSDIAGYPAYWVGIITAVTGFFLRFYLNERYVFVQDTKEKKPLNLKQLEEVFILLPILIMGVFVSTIFSMSKDVIDYIKRCLT